MKAARLVTYVQEATSSRDDAAIGDSGEDGRPWSRTIVGVLDLLTRKKIELSPLTISAGIER